MKKIRVLIVLVLLGGSGTSVWATPITVSFVPGSQTAFVAQAVDWSVFISGLGAGGPPNVGAFDLHVDFDSMVLAPLGVRFGPFLGDPDMLEAFTSVSLLPGRVELAEASLLSATALSSQTPSFLLAILQFRAIEAGFSRVSFSQIVVDDPFGAKLSVSGQDASIAVAAVPESSAWILLVAGLLARAVSGAPGWRRRRAE